MKKKPHKNDIGKTEMFASSWLHQRLVINIKPNNKKWSHFGLKSVRIISQNTSMNINIWTV